ncbi:MAG: glycosyltransferase family 2 protein [Micrococcales bacterium]|nr:glycosyltransferase family 2 protein [Micrococcales bacterium]NDF03734.1 glycosyltransferase family 2 protein [Betaproteobacteria bacterium]
MITLVGMVRDEAKYLAEWLAYHWLVGFESFLIFLHDCQDDSEAQIARLPFPVTTVSVTGAQLGWALKNETYAAGLAQVTTPWAACLDIDEFLFFPQHENVTAFLLQPQFQSASAIAVYQNIFGACGHENSPPGLVTQNYTRRNADAVLAGDVAYPQYRQPRDLFKAVKMLVRPADVIKVRDSHKFLCKRLTVDETGEPFKQYNICRHMANVRLNHYFTKSREDWAFKTARARLSGAQPYPDTWFEYFAAQTTIDTALADCFSAKLQAVLAHGS